MKDADIGRAMRELVDSWLEWHHAIDRQERTSELANRVEGYRVVDGGQVGSDGSWEVTDAETGEVLARGVGLDSFDSAWQDSWAHIDTISTEAHEVTHKPNFDFGLPVGLARVLVDWVVANPDEARKVVEQ